MARWQRAGQRRRQFNDCSWNFFHKHQARRLLRRLCSRSDELTNQPICRLFDNPKRFLFSAKMHTLQSFTLQHTSAFRSQPWGHLVSLALHKTRREKVRSLQTRREQDDLVSTSGTTCQIGSKLTATVPTAQQHRPAAFSSCRSVHLLPSPALPSVGVSVCVPCPPPRSSLAFSLISSDLRGGRKWGKARLYSNPLWITAACGYQRCATHTPTGRLDR